MRPSNDTTEEYYEDDFNKAFPVSYSQAALAVFDKELENMVKKSSLVALSIDDETALEKAMRDRSHLVKKIIIRSDGRKTIKWVNPNSGQKKPEEKKPESNSDKYSVGQPIAVKYHGRGNNADEFEVGSYVGKIEASKLGESYDKHEMKLSDGSVVTFVPRNTVEVKNAKASIQRRIRSLKAADKPTNKEVSALEAKLNIINGKKEETKPDSSTVKYKVGQSVTVRGADKPEEGTFEAAWDRHQHQLKTQRMGKTASLKAIEAKYGSELATKVREKHEKIIISTEKTV